MKKGESTGSKYKVPNLERALLLMEHLQDQPKGRTLAELTVDLAYPKNSVFRITATLLEHGYLDRDEKSKKFSLSRKLLAMGHRALSERPLIPLALDIMHECRDVVKESVLLGTIVEDEGVVMEQVLGSYPFKFSLDMGMRFKLHVAAPGKAILAYLPEGEQNTLIDRLNMCRYNERTITSKKELYAVLDQVRQNGYALDKEEQLHGIVCVGAPVMNHHGYPVAGLWMTGPADRITEDSYSSFGKQIRHFADRISARLGYD